MVQHKSPQKPPKPAHKGPKKARKGPPMGPDGLLLSRPGLSSPGLLFLFILIPILFGILTAFIQDPEVKPAVEVPVEIGKPLPEDMMSWELPPPPPSSVTGVGSGGRVPLEQPQCNFNELIGIKPNENLFARLKRVGKAYRVVQPGAQITMDYSPDRVNLELDEQGLIQRAWCG